MYDIGSSSDTDVSAQPFALNRRIIRAIHNNEDLFIEPEKFSYSDGKFMVKGHLWKASDSLRPTILKIQKVLLQEEIEIALDCISHTNSFLFENSDGFLLNYVCNK